MEKVKKLDLRLLLIMAVLLIVNVVIVANQYVNINDALDKEIIWIADSIRDLNSKIDMVVLLSQKEIPEDFVFIENSKLDYLVNYTDYYTEGARDNIEWIKRINTSLQSMIADGNIDGVELKALDNLKTFTSTWLVEAENIIEKYTGDMKLNKDILNSITKLNSYEFNIDYSLSSSENNVDEHDRVVGILDDILKNHILIDDVRYTGNKVDIIENNGPFNLYPKYYIDTSLDYIILFQITKYTTGVEEEALTPKEVDAIAEKFVSSFSDDMEIYHRTVRGRSVYTGVFYKYKSKEWDEQTKPIQFFIDRYGYIGGMYYPIGKISELRKKLI